MAVLRQQGCPSRGGNMLLRMTQSEPTNRPEVRPLWALCTSGGRRPWWSGWASHVILEPGGSSEGWRVIQPDRDDSKEELSASGPPSAHLCPRGLSQWLQLGRGPPASMTDGWVSMTKMRISFDFSATRGVPAPTQRGQATCVRHPRSCGLRSLDPKATVYLKCTFVMA